MFPNIVHILNQRLGLTISVLLAINDLASAQQLVSSNFTNKNYGTNQTGPWGVSLTDFAAAVSHPNATGNFPFPGPNFTAPSQASASGETWSWGISTTADIPSKDLAAGFFTGTRIVLNKPPSLLRGNSSSSSPDGSAHSSWRVCVLQWRLKDSDFSYTDRLRSGNGGCVDVLGDECISDIEREVQKSYDPSSGCTCPKGTGTTFFGCGNGNGLEMWGLGSSCVAKEFNATQLTPNGELEFLTYGGGPHTKGDIAAYNYTGSLPWPAVAIFVQPSIGKDNTTQMNKSAKMSCIRAKDAAQGSTAPGWSQSIGTILEARAQVAALAVLVAVSGLIIL